MKIIVEFYANATRNQKVWGDDTFSEYLRSNLESMEDQDPFYNCDLKLKSVKFVKDEVKNKKQKQKD